MQAWKVSKSSNLRKRTLIIVGSVQRRDALRAHAHCCKRFITRAFHECNACSQASKNDVYCMRGHCAVGSKRRASHRVSVSGAAKMEHYKPAMYGHCKLCLGTI